MKYRLTRFRENIDVLRASHVFSGLDGELLMEDWLDLRRITARKKSLIASAAECSEKFFIIANGRVRLFRRNPETGRELTLFLLSPGDVFDVISLLDGKPHGLAAASIDNVQLLAAPMKQVREWIARHPRVHLQLVPYAGKMLTQLADLAADVGLHDTGVRLARLILRHVDSSRKELRLRLINDLSDEELGKMIGTVRVVANRHIQGLKRCGAIESNRGSLVVKDLNKLAVAAKQSLPEC